VPPPDPPPGIIHSLITRPIQQRRLEFKYRCAQSLVFGIPVVTLQWFGQRLGGAEAARWAAVFQALLAGWVVYVAASGMVVEGVLVLVARRATQFLICDLSVSLIAIVVYAVSVGCLFARMFGQEYWLVSGSASTAAVVILVAWTGLRWLTLSRRQTDRTGA
jgi:hypothetical protein